jgi:hypothetical protein
VWGGGEFRSPSWPLAKQELQARRFGARKHPCRCEDSVEGKNVHGKMIFTDTAAMLGAVALTALSRWAAGRREYGTAD